MRKLLISSLLLLGSAPAAAQDRVTVLDPMIVVGQAPRPSVTFVMPRSRARAEGDELRQSFTPEIVRDATTAH